LRRSVAGVASDHGEARQWVATADGNRIILTVAGVEKTASSHDGAPVAATSGNLLGALRRRRDANKPVIEDPSASSAQSMPAPPPALTGPAFDPTAQSSASKFPPEPPRVAPH